MTPKVLNRGLSGTIAFACVAVAVFNVILFGGQLLRGAL